MATHNVASNCWVIYNKKVYNITAWVPIHDGGPEVFNSTTCGHDIAPYVSGSASSAGERHTHHQEAYDKLNGYYIAELK